MTIKSDIMEPIKFAFQAFVVIGASLVLINQTFSLQYAELLMSVAILTFTLMQVISMNLHYKLDKKRHLIEDMRNELEKAYGPLYTLFNPIGRDIRMKGIPWKDQKIYPLPIDRQEKVKLDNILSNFPFMFKQEIFTYWREFLQNPRPELEPEEGITIISERFISMIYEEYNYRVNKYNSLVGKKNKRRE